jgi:hypothetical protein
MAESALDTAEQIGMQVWLYEWLAVANGDTGAPIETIEGTFSTSGSCTMQGSNDGSTWHSLTDPQANAITKTAAGIEVIVEAPRYIRPSVTAGDGSTAIDVRLLARRGAR